MCGAHPGPTDEPLPALVISSFIGAKSPTYVVRGTGPREDARTVRRVRVPASDDIAGWVGETTVGGALSFVRGGNVRSSRDLSSVGIDGAGAVGDGLVILTRKEVGGAAAGVGRGVLGIQLDGAGEVTDGVDKTLSANLS